MVESVLQHFSKFNAHFVLSADTLYVTTRVRSQNAVAIRFSFICFSSCSILPQLGSISLRPSKRSAIKSIVFGYVQLICACATSLGYVTLRDKDGLLNDEGNAKPDLCATIRVAECCSEINLQILYTARNVHIPIVVGS